MHANRTNSIWKLSGRHYETCDWHWVRTIPKTTGHQGATLLLQEHRFRFHFPDRRIHLLHFSWGDAMSNYAVVSPNGYLVDRLPLSEALQIAQEDSAKSRGLLLVIKNKDEGPIAIFYDGTKYERREDE